MFKNCSYIIIKITSLPGYLNNILTRTFKQYLENDINLVFARECSQHIQDWFLYKYSSQNIILMLLPRLFVKKCYFNIIWTTTFDVK